jgi:hypothetical protein
MPVTYDDIYREADRLNAACAGNESMVRNSMGRSYYSVYQISLKFADAYFTPSVSASYGSTHAKLRDCFSRTTGAGVNKLVFKKIGYSLLRLHDRRVEADYHVDVSLNPDDAETSLKLAADLISVTQSLAKSLSIPL